MVNYSISAILDTRRKKGNDLYPVKIRVYAEKRTVLYPTGYDLSESEWSNQKPKKELKDKLDDINADLVKAQNIAKDLEPFSFKVFEKKYLRKTTDATDVFFFYDQKIAELKQDERIKTASNYTVSKKSIQQYLKYKGLDSAKLHFKDVTVKFLEGYEKWMLLETKEPKKSAASLTTISMYLRALRTVFNNAISEGEVDKSLYPFGEKGLYSIPSGGNKKKALDKPDLKKLFSYETEDPYIIKARAFWFFSYQANGMNVRDICELKYESVTAGKIFFRRTKTKRTIKKQGEKIQVILTPFLQAIIEKYGNKNTGPNTYVFPVFDHTMNAERRVQVCEAFVRYINQHMKRLAILVGVDPAISTYWARHSMTTVAVNSGASMEQMQEALGHQSVTTTQNYFKGFNDTKKKEIAASLMDF